MSIKETKEQIAAYAANPTQTGYDLLLDRIGEKGLIALVDNHTKLLEAAKRVNDLNCLESDVVAQIEKAIEEAEA